MESGSETDVYAGSETDISTEVYDVDLESVSSRHSVQADPHGSLLPGLWSPIRLYREASLDDLSACTAWCIDHGLLPRESVCHRHHRPRTLRYRSDREYLSWYCSKCDDYWSIASDTILERVRLPVGKFLVVALCYAHDMSYEDTQRACCFNHQDTVISSGTIAKYFTTFRELLIEALDRLNINGWNMIGGPGRVVQVDEALIGRRKYKIHFWNSPMPSSQDISIFLGH